MEINATPMEIVLKFNSTTALRFPHEKHIQISELAWSVSAKSPNIGSLM
jgi:hypothetical protein